MFVKICGITNESDALMATAMGTDAVGFVFAPSSRKIQPTQARDIARRLPPEILTVGVFRDEAPQRVVEVVNTAGLRGAQLHGFESPAEVAWVRQRVPFVVKAFAVGHPLLERLADYDVDAVLIDGPEPGAGETFDWDAIAGVVPSAKLLLAGGLRPDNVAAAIGALEPWGVDVSSGVESSPGHKDVRLVRRFINDARAAGNAQGTDGTVAAHRSESDTDAAWGPEADGSTGAAPMNFDPAPYDPAAPGALYDWEQDQAPSVQDVPPG